MVKETAQSKKGLPTRRTVGFGAALIGFGWARSWPAFAHPLASAVQSGSGARDVLPVSASGVPVSDILPAPDWSTLEEGPAVRISAVVDGDTVELERGPDVRMVGTQAPKLPLGRAHVEEWPLARASKALLEKLVADAGGSSAEAKLYFGGRKTDRHNRHLAHIVLADGTWLQGAMVLAGLARVYTFGDNRSLISDLLLREQVARQSQLEMWNHPYYSVRQADDIAGLLELTNHFELVEGRVLSVAAHRALWYLNFGRTWREDFTITIDRAHDDVFENSSIALSALEGSHVRVRGWIMEDGGPVVRIDHPEAIELLQPGAAPGQ